MTWLRELSTDQRRAFAAAYLAWMLDGFDVYILTFLLGDIQHSFSVDKAAAGALGSIALLFRVPGGIAAGAAADRWGRKPPLIASVLWYSAFACLSGFSTSYRMLFVMRSLFGIGMGAVWAAGVPLALEHLRPEHRGRASGVLQGGYSIGVILSALVFQLAYPIANAAFAEGWRAMLWIGIAPALLALWIVSSVRESPVWMQGRRSGTSAESARAPLFTAALARTLLQTTLVIAAFQVAYQAMTFWYPAYLASVHRPALPFVLALNAAGIAGAATWGRVSESSLGRRGAFTLAMGIGVVATPLYVLEPNGLLLLVGALVLGFFAAGSLGVAPGYLSERFPTAVRAAGAGFAYQVGAGIGAFTPYAIGALQDRGFALPSVMTALIVSAGLAMIGFVWLGPETRGKSFG
jgi:MFS transporter, SHS family, lactate transporter